MIRLKILTIITIFFTSFNANAELDVKARTAILQDFLSGEILYEKEPDKSIYPASMTKIMTTIIAFELIENGQLTLDEKFFVSENAWRLSQAGYSSMFIMVGDQISVENLLRGIFLVWFLHNSLNCIIVSNPLSCSSHVVLIRLLRCNALPIDFNPN